MDSALLDEEHLPDAIEGTVNPACDTSDPDTVKTYPLSCREGCRLPRAGSEGDLLSPRLGHGDQVSAWSALTRSPSLSGLSSPSESRRSSRAGDEVKRGLCSDLIGGSSQVALLNGGIYDLANARCNRSQQESQEDRQQLNVTALIQQSYAGMGFGESNQPGIDWPLGGTPTPARKEDPNATDIASITLKTHGKGPETSTKQTKSILDGCDKCGKSKWIAANKVAKPGETDPPTCACKHEDVVIPIGDGEITTSKPESSVVTKVQRVLDRMQSAFSTTSSSAVSRVSSVEERACRICWVGEEREDVITPCDCAGSSAFVHPNCLRKWLQVTTQYRCEICRHEYSTKRKMKPFAEWKFRGAKTTYMSQVEATLILLGIVTPPLICGIILCSQKIMEYINSPEDAWKTAALMTLVLASSCTYIAAIIYLCRKFTVLCKSWVKRNQTTIVKIGDIETVIEPEEDESSSNENDGERRERANSIGSRSAGSSINPGEGPSSHPMAETVMVWGLT